MHHVKRVAELVKIHGAGFGIRDEQLNDRRRIDYAAVPFAKAAGSCGNGLLADAELILKCTDDEVRMLV
jgi:hypothetical protein